MSTERVRAKGISIHRPVIYGNSAWLLTPEERASGKYPPDHTHRWTVAIRSPAPGDNPDQVGGGDDISYFIKKVTFKLHDSFANPTRACDKPPYEVSETGWGEFEIQIRVTFTQESGEKFIAFHHHLKLHPWTASIATDPPPPPNGEAPPVDLSPVHSWQYDEIVFTDPFQPFLNTLIAHPPTPLPHARGKPIPFNIANPTAEALEKSKGGTPEFYIEMEKEEAERLESARRTIIQEQEKWRARLIEKEKELDALKKQR